MFNTISKKLLSGYKSVCLLYIEENRVEDFFSHNTIPMEEIENFVSEGKSYDFIQEQFTRRHVVEEDQVRVLEQTSRQAIRDAFAAGRTVESIFRCKYPDGHIDYVKMRCLPFEEMIRPCAIITYEQVTEEVFFLQEQSLRDMIYENSSPVEAAIDMPRQKLLIVEDNELNREMLKAILQKEYDIVEAENGAVGLDYMKRFGKEVSVILLDLQMPIMDGHTFLEEIKKIPSLSGIPVIVASGEARAEEEERCLDLGAVDFINKPYKPAVILHRVKNCLQLNTSRQTLQVVEYDKKTGIYTKQAFLHHFEEVLKVYPNQNYHVILAEISNYNLIKAIYGEQKCAELFRYLADFLVNASGGNLVGRYGSSQFISLSTKDYEVEKETIEKTNRMLLTWSPVPNIEISYGLYKNVDKSLPAETICDRAALAVKMTPADREEILTEYDGPLAQKHLNQQLMEANFTKAIREEEFEVWYQPKCDAETGHITGAEALVRWRDPEGKLLPPDQFIPLFEEDGLITTLDEYVFSRVCAIQKLRIELGQEIFPISVNLSRRSLHAGDVEENYKAILERMDLPIELVPIEVTESVAMHSTALRDKLQSMKNAGFVIYMDDFGAGYSSLASLNILHYDVLKLDKSLVDFIGNPRGDVLLVHTIQIAKELGMSVIAEGVETKEQLELLRKMDCEEIQGYYFSPPVPYDKFKELAKQEV